MTSVGGGPFWVKIVWCHIWILPWLANFKEETTFSCLFKILSSTNSHWHIWSNTKYIFACCVLYYLESKTNSFQLLLLKPFRTRHKWINWHRCHQFLQYFILYQLWIVDLKHVLNYSIHSRFNEAKLVIHASNLDEQTKNNFTLIDSISLGSTSGKWIGNRRRFNVN